MANSHKMSPLATQALGRCAASQAVKAVRRGSVPSWAMLAAAFAILAFCSTTATAQTTHKDSTRYKSHTRDIGMSAASGNVGDPGTRGFKDPAQSLNPHSRSEAKAGLSAAGEVIARSSPAGSTDGWIGVRQDGAPSSTLVVSDAAAGVSGSDTGSEEWYFLAPGDRFSGDLSAAYNGRLSFTLTHSETPSSGKATKAPDVILEAACGHSLLLHGIAEKGGSLSAMLNEDSGWIDSRTRRPPGVMDFLGVLSHLSAVKIRGGFYSGAEATRLSGISLSSGKLWHPCCTIDGTVDICQKQPSSYYNPPNLQYYCEGHLYRPVRVLRVLPRFSRRTGGATITVVGENFGLAGSSPIVRINGRACQKTFFPPSVVRNDYGSLETGANTNAHLLAGTGAALVHPSNPAGNALVNAYSTATDSMKQRYPEHCWNGMQDDGTDKGYNYGTATAPKYINQGEQGIDAGGPCFPLHCSSCPVPTRVSGQLAGSNWNLGSGIFFQPVAGTVAAAATTSTPQLAADASKADDYYKGMALTSDCGGTVATRIITGYVGSTQVATLAAAITGLANTCTYKISPFLDHPTTGLSGTTLAATDTTLDLQTTGSEKADDVADGTYTGLVVTITGGVCVGQSRVITGHSSSALTFAALGTPCAGSGAATYSIGSPDLRGRCSSRNQIAAFESGDCSGRALTAAGIASACSSRFPYVKYPSFCPDDAEYSTTLKDMYSEATTGPLRAAMQRGIWGVEGLYSSLDASHKMVEGVTRVTRVNPLKADTSTATSAGLPTKALTIEVEDAVALCGIEVDGNLGAAGAQLLLDGELSASETTTITVDTGVDANGAYFGQKAAGNGAGWTDATALDQGTGFGYGYVMIEKEIIKVSAVPSATTLTIAQRGAFGTPITKHINDAPVYGVSVCRGAVLSVTPATGQQDVEASYPSTVIPDGPGTAQGGSTTTIQLAAGSSSVDGYYVGMSVVAVGGAWTAATTQAHVRRIVNYDGANKTATVDAAWQSSESAAAGDTYYITTQYQGYAAAVTTSAKTITLALGSSPTDDYYNGMRVRITGGTGVGSERIITDYVGSTRVATVNEAWTLAVASKYTIAPIAKDVFQAVSYHNAECDSKNYCTLVVSRSSSPTGDEILNRVNNGDIVRRVSAGRSTATTSLSAAGTDLSVASVASLFGATFVFDTAATRTISCGGDAMIAVTAASLHSNQIVVTTASTDNVGTTCVAGSVVSVISGTAPAGSTADSYASRGHFNYYTTFDAAGVLDSAGSDIAEFAPHRYIQMGGETMLITAVADANSGADGSSRAGNGFERLTVARGQLGSTVQAHPRGSKVTLLPRMAEVTAAMSATDDKVYLPSGMDIVANGLGSLTQTAQGIVVASALGAQTGISAQGGGSSVAAYIKIDDEVMKVVAVTTFVTDEGNEASLTVLRAQAGTLATAHSAGSMLRVLGCMDGDETGSNCGGSCKPCTAKSKGGPSQQERLICVTPEGVSGPGPSGQGAGDLAVTVESSPGPKDSPFGIRMNRERTDLVDASVSAVSCISEQNRGFQYGAHDFVWGVHIKSRDENKEVKITDIAVDRNTGETYVVGTMLGAIYLQGKHIHMSKDFGGELEVAPAQVTYIDSTAAITVTTTTATDANAVWKTTTYANEFTGKIVEIVAGGTDQVTGCTGRATTNTVSPTDPAILTFSALSKAGGACTGAVGSEVYRIHKGSAGFIAKFGKDGRPVWLNKLDTAHASNAHELVLTSVAVDPTSGAHYLAGHFSDGYRGWDDTTVPTLNYYSVDAATRVASSTAAGTIAALAADTYGQSPASADPGTAYQEGFLLKYSSAGQFLAKESIKGGKLAVNLVVSNLKVRAFHASTSSTLNTQVRSSAPAPTVKTSTSLLDVEYDFGMATAATLGGGTESRSSITLAATAAKYYPPNGQTLTNSGATGATEAMDNWYNGLKITITCGKGMGQERTIQDYDAATQVAYVQPHWDGGTMVPDTTSCYVISGKPSSHIHGQHLSSGGVYLTGNLHNPQAGTNAGDEYACFGQMPDAYRDTSASATGIPVCAKMTVDDEEANFVAQYDENLRAYWVRFIYDGQNTATTESDSGLITAIEAVDDVVFVAGTYGKNQWTGGTNGVKLRLQNCSFDSATVGEGPPANSQPKVVTLKKLCRMQTTALSGIGAFPVQSVNDLMATDSGTNRAETGATAAATQDFGILNTLAAEYVELPTRTAASATEQDMYVAAYDGSGSLLWYHYTEPSAASGVTASYSIQPTAIASVQPAIGNKPLAGHWKAMSDGMSIEGRRQPPDATSAKDISSERHDSATVRGGFVYVAGTVETSTADGYADFGITRHPLECSRGKVVGSKDSTAAVLNKMQDTACAGKVQSLGQTKDVFMATYAALGTERAATSSLTTPYGAGRQPDLQHVRRTGGVGTHEEATGITVHDLTGSAFVIGTYTASATGKYQGSNVGEKGYLASTGNDGSSTYVATREATITDNSGDDHFGLKDANRVDAVGCPMQRFAPSDQHEERLGLTGRPDCTLYSHADSTATTTGFVVKFNDNGDETLRGNKNRKNIPSITGKMSLTGTCATSLTCASSITPCSGGTGGVGETQMHVYTNSQACSTYPGGCSCVFLNTATLSKDSAGAAHASTGDGLANTWNGKRIRITRGKAAGYEGVISAYEAGTAADHVYFTVPALPAVPDHTSEFQIFDSMEPQPKIHLSTCAAGTVNAGCAANGVEWAKTVGMPIGQTLYTRGAHGAPTNMPYSDGGAWKQVGGAGTAESDGLASNGDVIVLHVDDVQGSATYFDSGYVVYLSTDTQEPFSNIMVGEVSGPNAYTVPAAADGGKLKLICRKATLSGADNIALSGITSCPVASTVHYKLVEKDASTTGVSQLTSKGSRQESAPVSVSIVDGDVYIGGKFKGFDEFHFGLEGVDETVGYKSVGYDTWESYLVKLED